MSIDRREDAGDFYPGGKVVSTRPIAGGADMKHEDFSDVAALPSRFTDTMVHDKINELIGLLKGPSTAVALLLGVAAFGAGVTVQTAPKGEVYNDEPIVTNVTWSADGLVTPEMVTNIVQDVSPEPDFSPSNATLVATIEATSPAPGDYAAVSNAAMTAVQPSGLSFTNDYLRTAWKDDVLSEFAGHAAEASQADYATKLEFGSNLLDAKTGPQLIEISTNYTDAAISRIASTIPNNITRTATDATLVNGTNALVYIRQASSSLAGLMTAADKTKLNGIPSDVGATVSTISNDCAATRAIVTTWEGFLDGSNVVFSITNYLSGTYALDEAKLKIMELREGAYQEVYNSRDEIVLHIDHFKTNEFANATNSVMSSVAARLDEKADKTWGRYTSAGGEAPSNTVYMTAPNTVFAGGLEYERVAVGEGTICVLTTKGAPTYTQGDEGTFKFQDSDGEHYFGFSKTDSYTIGANTDGITAANGIVTLTYNITMSGRPCVWYKADLTSSTPWEQLNMPDGSAAEGASHAVSWEQNPPANTQVCYINCGTEPQGFFRATVEVAGEAKFMTNMRADLAGGIQCTNTASGVVGVIRPLFNGSVVNWVWSAN